jgi:hypothetical protein
MQLSGHPISSMKSAKSMVNATPLAARPAIPAGALPAQAAAVS